MSNEEQPPVVEALASAGEPVEDLGVEVAYEVIQLLSSQLYSSPLKAIEELVVNAWDADARECRIFVPAAGELSELSPESFVAVLDNGHGMTVEELRDLWHVGESHKRDEKWQKRAKRKQIGKFGIGKLASYVLARRVTYITRAPNDDVRGVTLDFEDFMSARQEDGTLKPIELTMLRVASLDDLLADERFAHVIDALGTTAKSLKASKSWTLVVLENLKEKAKEIRAGRLNWVLRTAMPLASDFDLFLNGNVVESAKVDYTWLVDFNVAELDAARLKSLAEVTGEEWTPKGERLVAPSFPSGVTGRVRVADRSLYAASKSSDLGRSHGFFIRVLNRLVNETDPLFGVKPLSFTTFYNLLVEVEADDLDAYIKAPRDDVEQTEERAKFQALLEELFRQARERYEAALTNQAEKEKEAREGSRTYVNPRLVERPVADALVNYHDAPDDDAAWVYLNADTSEDAVQELVTSLYTEADVRRRYAYRYRDSGRTGRLVEFDPTEATFWINEQHELVIENFEDPESRRLLETLVTAEALLEVYMREIGISHPVVEHVLNRRDELLRSLARDEIYSLGAISQSLRDAAEASATELEIAVVAALRALGFATRHIGGSGTPDGLASYAAYSANGKSFTLEAKSSQDIPMLPNLDFAGLRQHYEDADTDGCLLVAPSYPGGSKSNESEVAKRATTQRVSCWTVAQLSRAVELAEARHINANDIQVIVLNVFTPDDVAARVEQLLTEPDWDRQGLYRAILETLAELESVLVQSQRDIGMLASPIALKGFAKIETKDIEDAVEQLAKASQGMLHLTRGGKIHIHGSLDELRRRLANLTGEGVEPRRKGTFRARATD